MSSNPLKLKIKFSKGPGTSTEPKAADGSAKASKKRKAVSGQPPEHQRAKVDRPNSVEGRHSHAERDVYAEAKKPRTGSQAQDVPRDGNQAASPRSEQQSKPRLVIK